MNHKRSSNVAQAAQADLAICQVKGLQCIETGIADFPSVGMSQPHDRTQLMSIQNKKAKTNAAWLVSQCSGNGNAAALTGGPSLSYRPTSFLLFVTENHEGCVSSRCQPGARGNLRWSLGNQLFQPPASSQYSGAIQSRETLPGLANPHLPTSPAFPLQAHHKYPRTLQIGPTAQPT